MSILNDIMNPVNLLELDTNSYEFDEEQFKVVSTVKEGNRIKVTIDSGLKYEHQYVALLRKIITDTRGTPAVKLSSLQSCIQDIIADCTSIDDLKLWLNTIQIHLRTIQPVNHNNEGDCDGMCCSDCTVTECPIRDCKVIVRHM